MLTTSQRWVYVREGERGGGRERDADREKRMRGRERKAREGWREAEGRRGKRRNE